MKARLLSLLNHGDPDHFDQALELIAALQDRDLCDSLLRGVCWHDYNDPATKHSRGQTWVNRPSRYDAPKRVAAMMEVAVGSEAERLRAGVRTHSTPEAYYPNLERIALKRGDRRTYSKLREAVLLNPGIYLDAPNLRELDTRATTWAEALESMAWAVASFPKLEQVKVNWYEQDPRKQDPALMGEFRQAMPEGREGLRLKIGWGYAAVFMDGAWRFHGDADTGTMAKAMEVQKYELEKKMRALRWLHER